MLTSLKRDLRALANPEKATILQGFFKTGKGQYGEGDRFLGVTVPQMRSVAKTYRHLPWKDIAIVLADPIHEYRFVALEILCFQYDRGDAADKKKVVDFYLSHLDGVNNWDLVDTSAYCILGAWLLDKNTAILDRLVASGDLWTQRIAIVATYAFIREKRFGETLRMAEALMDHPHDLIHKAVGWMLREVGNRDKAV